MEKADLDRRQGSDSQSRKRSRSPAQDAAWYYYERKWYKDRNGQWLKDPEGKWYPFDDRGGFVEGKLSQGFTTGALVFRNSKGELDHKHIWHLADLTQSRYWFDPKREDWVPVKKDPS